MKLKYDFIVDLATGHSRTSKKWRNRHWQWSELLERCSKTQRTNETATEYARRRLCWWLPEPGHT